MATFEVWVWLDTVTPNSYVSDQLPLYLSRAHIMIIYLM
eukprot:COSAG01_NODE_37374_length_504_cov_1.143210_2_plen_39_part_00